MWQDMSAFVFAQETSSLLTDTETTYSNMVSTRQQACPKKTVVTQREGLPRNVAVQVSGCRECQSLLMPREDGKDITCVRCKQAGGQAAQPDGGA